MSTDPVLKSHARLLTYKPPPTRADKYRQTKQQLQKQLQHMSGQLNHQHFNELVHPNLASPFSAWLSSRRMNPKGVYDLNGRSSPLSASRQGHKLSLSNQSDMDTEAVPVRSLSALKRYPHVSSIDTSEDLLQALMPSGSADKDEVRLLQLADAVDDLRCQCASVSAGASRMNSAYTSPTSTPTATQRKPASMPKKNSSRKKSPTPPRHFPSLRGGLFSHALPPSTMSSPIAGQWKPPILASPSSKVAKRSAMNSSQTHSSGCGDEGVGKGGAGGGGNGVTLKRDDEERRAVVAGRRGEGREGRVA